MGRYSCFDPFHSVFESHSSVDGCWRGSPLQHPLCNIMQLQAFGRREVFPPSPVRHDLEDLRRGAWSQPEPPRQDRFSCTGHVIVSPCFPYCLVLKSAIFWVDLIFRQKREHKMDSIVDQCWSHIWWYRDYIPIYILIAVYPHKIIIR